jgi:putative transposase
VKNRRTALLRHDDHLAGELSIKLSHHVSRKMGEKLFVNFTVGGITPGDGLLPCVTVLLDLYSRLVVGWAVSESLMTELVEQAFMQGQRRRGTTVSPLIHSDRGSQYASSAFRERLAAWDWQQSMSRKGNCWDNAVTESFFGILKSEMVYHERFATRRETKDKLFDYLEVFYNRSRIHSASDYFAPAGYEARYQAQMKQAA